MPQDEETSRATHCNNSYCTFFVCAAVDGIMPLPLTAPQPLSVTFKHYFMDLSNYFNFNDGILVAFNISFSAQTLQSNTSLRTDTSIRILQQASGCPSQGVSTLIHLHVCKQMLWRHLQVLQRTEGDPGTI